jgi:hypothetical protein
MFRFSIRELLLVTVIVALIFGWRVREGQLNREVTKALEWRARTVALERFLVPEWRIEWHLNANSITFYETRRPGHIITMPIDISKPYSGHPSFAVPAPSAPTPNPPSD